MSQKYQTEVPCQNGQTQNDPKKTTMCWMIINDRILLDTLAVSIPLASAGEVAQKPEHPNLNPR